MKIAVRGGHNSISTGCSGLIEEVTEDRKVKDAVIKYLKAKGHTVIDVTPKDCDHMTDLYYGVGQANKHNVDLFLSIHFNKRYLTYREPIGSETWIFPGSKAGTFAHKICSNLGKLGFKNRGVKNSTSLYELKATKMPTVVVEVCFVESSADVKIYKNQGFDKVGQAIAEAI